MRATDNKDRASLLPGQPGFLLFGGGDTHGVIERFATLAEAIAAIECYRRSPETLPPISPAERSSIDEMGHQVEFLGEPCPYRNHGKGRAFYVTHLNRRPGFEPDMPGVVVEV